MELDISCIRNIAWYCSFMPLKWCRCRLFSDMCVSKCMTLEVKMTADSFSRMSLTVLVLSMAFILLDTFGVQCKLKCLSEVNSRLSYIECVSISFPLSHVLIQETDRTKP